MKFIHITFHFEYNEVVEELLDEHGVEDYTRYSMIEGKDCDGKHFGNEIYPGNTSVVQGLIREKKIDDLFAELEEFKNSKKSRQHIRAVVLPVDRIL